MNVIKCTKCGKFYDVDKFLSCPHCMGDADSQFEKKSVSETIKKSDTENTKKTIRERFIKKEKSNNNIDPKTLSAFSAGYYNSEDSSDEHEESYDESNKTTDNFVEDTDASEKILEEKKEKVEPELEDDSEEPVSSPNNSLTEEINNITKNNTGRTLSYFSLGDSDESTKSVPNESKKASSEVKTKPAPDQVQSAPVVGWLVCIKGNHLGESFQIYDGNNSIGRGDSNDVILFKEPSVSSNKHAIIIYEPEKRYFLIQSGDSHGLTYLNDDLVTIPQKINIYDSIRFGKSSFIFIPLCGEQFSREEYIGR